jgi:hypothetical protein
VFRNGVAVIAACALQGFPVAVWPGDVIVTQAWISAAPPTVRVNAGYLRVENKGTRNLILVGAESPRFAGVEMHRSEMQDGVYSMHRQYSLVIAGGQSISFAPGGLHFMLFGSAAAPRPKEIIPLTLIFADGERVPVRAEVRPPQSGVGHHNH